MKTVEINKRHTFVCGLPRSGSTLLCQLLSHHESLSANRHSSPLAHVIGNMRDKWSNDSFLLSQLDGDFDAVYQRLLNSMRGTMNGWFHDAEESIVVDKNRAWLGMLDLANALDPKSKFIVCVRELGQLYGSIEAQHQKTVLLDSGDRTAGMTPYGRATAYFKDGGLVASCLSNLESSLEDYGQDMKNRIYFLKYEDLLDNPKECLDSLSDFLEIAPFELDFDALKSWPSEADSHYRFKFTHRTYESIRPARQHAIPSRTQNGLVGQHEWFYRVFYPHLLNK